MTCSQLHSAVQEEQQFAIAIARAEQYRKRLQTFISSSNSNVEACCLKFGVPPRLLVFAPLVLDFELLWLWDVCI